MFKRIENGEPAIYFSEENLRCMYETGMAKKEFYILMTYRPGGLSDREIAKNLGLSVKSVKKTIRKLKNQGSLIDSPITSLSPEEKTSSDSLDKANKYFFGGNW